MKVRIYNTYSFRDKDPVIDHLRTAVQKSKMSYDDIAEKSGVSVGTLLAWFEGKTKSPQFKTAIAVARAIGPEGIKAVVNAVTRGK